MELDVRTKDGDHKVSLYGDIAESTFKYLAKREDVKIDSKIFGGKSINCFVAIPDKGVGFRMTGTFEIILLKDEYIKIIK